MTDLGNHRRLSVQEERPSLAKATTGLALILAPETAMKLLQARDDYGDVMPRVMGILFVALGVIVS